MSRQELIALVVVLAFVAMVMLLGFAAVDLYMEAK